VTSPSYDPAVDDGPVLSWQALAAARDRAAARWPSPFRLPLLRRPSDALYGRLRGEERILDVGSGDRTRRDRIAARHPGVDYVAVDPDPGAGADHRRIEEAEGTFDAVTLFEVLEHLRPVEAVSLLRGAREKLRPGGFVVVSVPCTHTPGRFQRDCTHLTPWAHDELGAALLLAGLEPVAIHRTYPGTFAARALRRFLLGPLGHLLGVDYAHSYVAVAVRRDGANFFTFPASPEDERGRVAEK
jgi:SAM-dependent methyltransferase